MAAPEGEIIIHTMRDDLRSLPSRAAAPAKRQGPAEKGPTLPLPPRPSARKDKMIRVPERRSLWRRIGGWRLGLAAMVVLAIGASAAGAYYWWLNLRPENSQPGERAAIGNMVPANTALVVYYSLASEEARADLRRAWEEKNGSELSIISLLNGDPRLLLEIAEVKEIAYIVLSEDPRPYLLVPKIEATRSLLEDNFDASLAEVRGWYVAHPLSVELYQQASTDGGQETSLAEAADELQISVSGSFWQNLRERAAGEQLAKGNVSQRVEIRLKMSSLATPRIEFEGRAAREKTTEQGVEVPAASGAETLDTTLLALVPDDVEWVRLGANFRADAEKWPLLQPEVLGLLDNWQTPYALYRRIGQDQVEDFGLVVSLPEETTLSDPALAEGIKNLSALTLPDLVTSWPAWAEGEYKGIALRFANLAGPTKAVDYTVFKNHLLAATSKEGIFALLDTAQEEGVAIPQSARWQRILNLGSVSEARAVVLLSLKDPLLNQLLPLLGPEETLVGMKVQLTNEELTLHGQASN
jgi:hypothetical protein